MDASIPTAGTAANAAVRWANASDQWLAATGRSITHHDARESIASHCSALRGISTVIGLRVWQSHEKQ
jgi:hypothetical protein